MALKQNTGMFYYEESPNDEVFLRKHGKAVSHLIFEKAIIFHENQKLFDITTEKKNCIDKIQDLYPEIKEYPILFKDFVDLINRIFNYQSKSKMFTSIHS